MKMSYKLLFAVTLFGRYLMGQQTPQINIIPYKDGTPGTIRFNELRSNGINYAAIRSEDVLVSDCTFRISDVVFIPCASYQTGLGRAGTRFDSLYSRFIDLTSSSTPSSAQLYVRRFANAGIISAIDNGSNEMEFTVSNDGVEKFFVGEIISRVGVPMETGQLRPLVTSTSSLGTNTRRWTNFFTDNANITTGIRIGSSTTAGWVLTADASGNGSWQPSASGSALPVTDTQAITKNAIDNTKQMRFSNALQSTGTTRVLTNPDADITLAGIDLAQTWTATQTMRTIVPSVTSTYSFGSTGSRWTNVFTDNATITTGIRIGTSSTSGWVLTTDASGNGSWQPSASGTALPVVDTQTITRNAVDNTKLMRFSNALQTTGTTRVLTNPDANITIAGINLAQTWTATQNFQTIEPSVSSTYSNGTNARRWTNTFTDNINITSGFRLTTSATFGNVLTTDVSGNGSWQPIPVAGFGTAGILTAGAQSISGAKTFLDTMATQSLNITGTTTHTGTIQFSTDALYNIGSSPNRANQVWMSQSRATAYYYNGSLGVTGTFNFGTCSATVTAGGITATSGVC